MSNESLVTPQASTEIAKQAGKVLLHSLLDIIKGEKPTGILKWIATGFRVFGIALVVMAIFKLGWFSAQAEVMGWFKSLCYGLAEGVLAYGTGELITLLIRIEAHLQPKARA